MTALVLYSLVSAAVWHLLAQATITRWLWSRYPPRLDAFLSCAACTGFWLGLGCGALGRWLDLPFLGLDSDHPATIVAAGLSMTIATPVVAWAQTAALMQLSGQGGEDASTPES